MSNHIIHKQEVLLNVQDIDNAFKYQQTVSNLFANDLTNLIEQILNKADAPGKVTRINKLSLDLGEINSTTFNEDFKERLTQQLKTSLESINDKTDVEVSVTKPSLSLREGIVFFLEKGILPWYIKAKDMAALETAVFNEWNESDWLAMVNWLRQNADSNYVLIERLAQQFSREFLKELVTSSLQQTIDNEEWKLLLNDLEFIYSKIDAPAFSSSFPVTQSNYIIVFLQNALSKSNSFTLHELVALQLRDLFLNNDDKKFSANNKNENWRNDDAAILINNDKQLFAVNDNNSNAQKILLETVHSKIVINILKNIYFIERTKIPLLHVSAKDLLETEKYIIDKYQSFNIGEAAIINNNKRETQIKKPKQTKNIEEDVLFVDNCGIVLLHPFLQAYFDGLLLTENKKFVSEDAQKRAILLLHYLSTGETEVAEFNLILQKILCGLGIDESLPSAIILLQDEIKESQKLLQSVIDYWPPLKNTSTEGLQATFLQRKGKLANTDAGWQLTVEQKTVDILIGKLPWGFSTIKLPWMRGVLNVEWC